MTEPDANCSDERLWSLLLSADDSDEQSESLEHVDGCERCQVRLEQLAAEPREWRVAQDSLVSGESDEETSGVTSDDRRWNRFRWRRNPSAWTDSMAERLLSPPSHPEMLGRIGRYDVERWIGSGGMGMVFKAFDTELNRPVVVKVLAPHLAGSGAARKRFAREARAAAAVVHEHVVAIHNVESGGPAPFLVMPFIAGESLQQRIDREGPLELCEILRIARQTAAGLAAAHAQGLVHRDVKPSNILLEQGIERALLTDFGLARASDDASLTHTGYHLGTPQFMSPEQARGDAIDARSDLFSLGSVIYSMCTGRSPFRAETSYGILRRITDTEPRAIRETNPVIPDWFERIVRRLLAKSPSERFQSAGEVAELLEQCLAHVQQPTSVQLPECCRKSSRSTWHGFRMRWLRAVQESPIAQRCIMVLAVTVVIVASVWAAVAWSSKGEPTQASDDAGLAAMPVDSATDHSDPATDWDPTAFEIESFDRDLAPFEIRSHQLWDDDPEMNEE